MDIGIYERFLGIKAIINSPQCKHTWYSLTYGTLT